MTAKAKLLHCSGIVLLLLLLSLVCECALATPMLYKKTTQDKYEADLVPVSSTVIPLTVLEVSYGLGGKPSEEYKMAYLKKLRKKVQHPESADQEDPDTLITIKKKHHEASKAKVKGVSSN
ncbi:uncharacterized protein LOC119675347 [Teleopsis dalmanni]|uniref:uncharacterized protein LOC119675341 n=1 Tax=Teleopsis dalmanni TaxID=139649 RepID=UPI0018CEEF62|nr:uncharacterized protein LOC119675341 [Teleopsis dalmanni]XP_037942472.1 uncharacterized protein LOC119675347 [Teleopsis dalmanni]